MIHHNDDDDDSHPLNAPAHHCCCLSKPVDFLNFITTIVSHRNVTFKSDKFMLVRVTCKRLKNKLVSKQKFKLQ